MQQFKTKYLLISQGIPITLYEDKEKALDYMNNINKEYYDYLQAFLDDYTPEDGLPVDNRISMKELNESEWEELQVWVKEHSFENVLNLY